MNERYKYFWDHIIFSSEKEMCNECFTDVYKLKVAKGLPVPPGPICRVNLPVLNLRADKARGYTLGFRQDLKTGQIDRTLAICSKDNQFSRSEGRAQCMRKFDEGVEEEATYESVLFAGSTEKAFDISKTEMRELFAEVEVR